MKQRRQDGGFSLVEIMIAAVVAGIALTGTMGAVEIASRFVHQAGLAENAQASAESRLEVKRSVRWRLLLEDDLDRDGVLETVMKDDGQNHDVSAGDGMYTMTAERDGMTERWTVEVDRPGPIVSAGMVIIRSVVTYDGSNGPEEVHMETMRANPAFVGRAQF